jgi:hypothetical protein
MPANRQSYADQIDAFTVPSLAVGERPKPAVPRSTPLLAPPQPRRQLPAVGLALLWALAAVSGSSFVLMMDQAQFRPSFLAVGESYNTTSSEAIARPLAAAMARTALLRLDDASRASNFAVFRDRAAASFQKMNSADDLQRIFGWLREHNVSLATAATLDPATLSPSVMEKGDILHVRGSLRDDGQELSFDVLFQQEGGTWKVFGIAVYRG